MDSLKSYAKRAYDALKGQTEHKDYPAPRVQRVAEVQSPRSLDVKFDRSQDTHFAIPEAAARGEVAETLREGMTGPRGLSMASTQTTPEERAQGKPAKQKPVHVPPKLSDNPKRLDLRDPLAGLDEFAERKLSKYGLSEDQKALMDSKIQSAKNSVEMWALPKAFDMQTKTRELFPKAAEAADVVGGAVGRTVNRAVKAMPDVKDRTAGNIAPAQVKTGIGETLGKMAARVTPQSVKDSGHNAIRGYVDWVTKKRELPEQVKDAEHGMLNGIAKKSNQVAQAFGEEGKMNTHLGEDGSPEHPMEIDEDEVRRRLGK